MLAKSRAALGPVEVRRTRAPLRMDEVAGSDTPAARKLAREMSRDWPTTAAVREMVAERAREAKALNPDIGDGQ